MLGKQTVVNWYTTPDELRRLADQLQKRWDEAKLGDDLKIFGEANRNLELWVIPDEDLMRK
jgi:hypothetical protein